jgi:hypothetical protein
MLSLLGLRVASRLTEVKLATEIRTDEKNNTSAQVNLPEAYASHLLNRNRCLKDFRWQLLLNSRLDWNYTTVPQLISGKAKTINGYLSSYKGYNSRPIEKVLGDSSSIGGQRMLSMMRLRNWRIKDGNWDSMICWPSLLSMRTFMRRLNRWKSQKDLMPL